MLALLTAAAVVALPYGTAIDGDRFWKLHRLADGCGIEAGYSGGGLRVVALVGAGASPVAYLGVAHPAWTSLAPGQTHMVDVTVGRDRKRLSASVLQATASTPGAFLPMLAVAVEKGRLYEALWKGQRFRVEKDGATLANVDLNGAGIAAKLGGCATHSVDPFAKP